MKTKFSFIVLVFFFAILPCLLQAQSWEGKWKCKYDRDCECNLEITNVTSSSFDFIFESNCDNRSNVREGKAIIKGNSAFFDGGTDNLCPIDFSCNRSSITVEESSQNDCKDGSFDGIRFVGKYKKNKLKEK